MDTTVTVAATHDRLWTRADLEPRIVRYAALEPCYNAFIDCRTPGSQAKENFTIIGPGVSENPAQHVHIAEPHGYNIGGARQPVGCVNSQHSHDTAELFAVHSGAWRFDLGEHGKDAQLHLTAGDVISIPTGVFRGFTATEPAADGSPGFLWAVLGGDDPGRVLWAPDVFAMARDYGLVLLDNGALVDVHAGQRIPADAAPMPPTTRAQADALHRVTQAEANSLVWRATAPGGGNVLPIVGEQAPLTWPHGFALVRIDVEPGGTFRCGGDASGRQVRFVHRGHISIAAADGPVTLSEGDTISLPEGFTRDFSSPSGATVFAVWAV